MSQDMSDMNKAAQVSRPHDGLTIAQKWIAFRTILVKEVRRIYVFGRKRCCRQSLP